MSQTPNPDAKAKFNLAPYFGLGKWVFRCICLIFLALGLKQGIAWCKSQLGKYQGQNIEFGDWTLQIAHWDWSWQKVQFQQTRLVGPSLKLRIPNFDLHLDWFSWLHGTRFAEIQADTIQLRLIARPPAKDTQPFKPLDIKIPAIPWSFHLSIGTLQLEQNKQKFQLDQIEFWHDQSQSLDLKAQGHTKLLGLSQLKALPIQLWARLNWANDSLRHTLLIQQGSNLLRLQGSNTLLHLQKPSTQLQLHLHSADLIKVLPHLAPQNVDLSTQIQWDLQHKFLKSQGQTKLNTLELDPDGLLPAFQWQINYNVQGQPQGKLQLNAQITGLGAQGQLFKGQIQSDLTHTQFELHTQNWRWQIASFSLPLQIQFLKGELAGQNLRALLQTPEGSQVQILAQLKPLKARLIGQFSDREPWIYTWTGPQLQLRKANADLVFTPGWKLRGKVRAQVENAWTAYADSAHVLIDLDAHQIRFPQIQVFFGNKKPTFDGFVNWAHPHHVGMEFKTLRQDSSALFQMQVPGEMEVKAINYPLDALPLHFIPKDFNPHGSLNGQMSLPQHGHLYGLLTLDGKYPWQGQNIPWRISTVLAEDSNSYQLQQLSIHAFGDQILGSMQWLKDPRLSLLQKFAQIKLEQFQIDLSHYRLDHNHPWSGQIYGSMNWAFNPGEHSPKVLSKIHLAQINLSDSSDQTLLSIPSALLEIDSNQNFQIQGLVDAGPSRELSGKFHSSISPLFPNQSTLQQKLMDLTDIRPWLEMSRAVKCTLSTNVGGLALLDLRTSSERLLDSNGLETELSIQKLTGLGNISGPWSTPVKNLEIPNSNVLARIDWTLNGGMDSLFVKLLRNQVTLSYPNIPDQQINISGNLKNQFINLDLLINDSTLNKFNISTQFNLRQMQVSQLYGYSPKYVLRPSPDQYLGLFQVELNHLRDLQGEHFPLKIDSSYYQYFDATKGLVRAEAKAQVSLLLPQNSTENPSLKGDLWVNKAIYENNLNFDLDPWAFFTPAPYRKFSNLVSSFFKSKQPQLSAKTKSLDLDLNISDRNSDSLYIYTSLAQVPLSLNMKIQGNLQQPLLQGGISNTEPGILNLGDGQTPFNIDEIAFNWNGSSAEKGNLLLRSSGDMHLCEVDPNLSQGNRQDSICQVNLDMSGPLDNINFKTKALCNTSSEMNTSNVLVSMVMHQCLSSNSNISDLTLNPLIDQLLSKNASKVIKKTRVIEKINFDGISERLYNGVGKDSAKVDLQIKLPWLNPDKFKFTGGIVLPGENTSSTDQTMTSNSYGYLGLDWILWQNKNKNRKEMLAWETSGLSKNGSTTDGTRDVNSFALRTGLTWQKFFWEFCLFGFGFCEAQSSKEKASP